jgi:hypothetical protein
MEPARAAVRVAILILVVSGCGGGKPRPPLQGLSTAAPPRHEHLASIQRTHCYGTCPVYQLTVYRDGVVEYDGGEFVKVQGKAAGKLGPREVTALEELFRKHGYLKLADSYEAAAFTDAASIYTAYTPEGGKRKEVKHYLGDLDSPPGLHEIEEGFEKLVKIERWIGTDQERDKLNGR